MYLNIAINYLKGEHYIRCENGKCICDKLPSGILADVLKEFILQRYDKLDDTLKEVLSKSSIIGNVFNAELLSKPFQIINADDMLQKIEKISQLIVRPDDKTYSFETNDVYQLIKNSVSPEQQKEWHEILANYYKKLLKKEAPDLVLTYSIKPNIYIGLLCRKTKIPYYANVQGLGTAFQKPVLISLVTVLYRIAFQNVQRVFFENEENAWEFRERKILSADRQVVLSGAGINLERYQMAPYPNHKRMHFLYLGRIMKEKEWTNCFILSDG